MSSGGVTSIKLGGRRRETKPKLLSMAKRKKTSSENIEEKRAASQ